MLLKIVFAIILLNSQTAVGKKTKDYMDIYIKNDSYSGEKFPAKYLDVDGVVPTYEDFVLYKDTLYRVIDFFTWILNTTDPDPNVAIGSYFMKAILKRVVLDYNQKMRQEDLASIKRIISKAEDVVSYFVYDSQKYGSDDLSYHVSMMFKYDESLVVSMGRLHRGGLRRWLAAALHPNNLTEHFDDLSLPKEVYVELVTDMAKYYPITDSDKCISKIGRLLMPIRADDALRPARYSRDCEKKVFRMPSVAYALSHRMLYIMLVRLTRRSYLISAAADQLHLDVMCAAMYRETVYLARRGYFYRDLFLEHIALCGLLGYEELYRPHWFKKAASWVDGDGCMAEFRNFEVNRTRLHLARQKTSRGKKIMRRVRHISMNEECAYHQMALVMNVLALGVRHAAHYMKAFISN